MAHFITFGLLYILMEKAIVNPDYVNSGDPMLSNEQKINLFMFGRRHYSCVEKALGKGLLIILLLSVMLTS
jgi:hypothetical protein